MTDLPAPAAASRPPGLLRVAVASFTGNLFLFGASITLGLLSLPVSLLPPRGYWSFGLMKVWSRGLLRASGARVVAASETVLDPGQSYVFLANHQSLFDIPAVISTIPLQVRFAAKRSLFRIPVFGWSLHAAGFIPVDRGVGSKAADTFAAAQKRLETGLSVLFFPEGTRSLDGKLGEFQRGGFLLALKSGRPIVPVGIHGTLQIQRRGQFSMRPGTVRVTYGAPIDPAEYGVRRRAELETEVRRRVGELAGAELG